MTDDLRDLVEQWRAFANHMDASKRVAGYAQGFEDAADELEEWLDENEERTNARVISEPYASRRGNNYGVDDDD